MPKNKEFKPDVILDTVEGERSDCLNHLSVEEVEQKSIEFVESLRRQTSNRRLKTKENTMEEITQVKVIELKEWGEYQGTIDVKVSAKGEFLNVEYLDVSGNPPKIGDTLEVSIKSNV